MCKVILYSLYVQFIKIQIKIKKAIVVSLHNIDRNKHIRNNAVWNFNSRI